jgi:hypothetical protein
MKATEQCENKKEQRHEIHIDDEHPERGAYSIFNWPKRDFEAHMRTGRA